MKLLKKTYITLLALLAVSSSMAFAQQKDLLKTYELPQFTELNVQMNTEVIILKSNRNMMVIQGDSLTQKSINFDSLDGKLTIIAEKGMEAFQPTRVLIETISLSSITTSGTGKYFLIGHQDNKIGIYNSPITALNTPK